MIIYVDIDGTICSDNGAKPKTEKDYLAAEPYIDRIEKINRLYDEGNTIVYWTARGATKGIDWTEVTRQQLEEWGCKYHELLMNSKPHFDMYICDKSFNSEVWFTQN
jgi:hypothetical protein